MRLLTVCFVLIYGVFAHAEFFGCTLNAGTAKIENETGPQQFSTVALYQTLRCAGRMLSDGTVETSLEDTKSNSKQNLSGPGQAIVSLNVVGLGKATCDCSLR